MLNHRNLLLGGIQRQNITKESCKDTLKELLNLAANLSKQKGKLVSEQSLET